MDFETFVVTLKKLNKSCQTHSGAKFEESSDDYFRTYYAIPPKEPVYNVSSLSTGLENVYDLKSQATNIVMLTKILEDEQITKDSKQQIVKIAQEQLSDTLRKIDETKLLEREKNRKFYDEVLIPDYLKKFEKFENDKNEWISLLPREEDYVEFYQSFLNSPKIFKRKLIINWFENGLIDSFETVKINRCNFEKQFPGFSQAYYDAVITIVEKAKNACCRQPEIVREKLAELSLEELILITEFLGFPPLPIKRNYSEDEETVVPIAIFNCLNGKSIQNCHILISNDILPAIFDGSFVSPNVILFNDCSFCIHSSIYKMLNKHSYNFSREFAIPFISALYLNSLDHKIDVDILILMKEVFMQNNLEDLYNLSFVLIMAKQDIYEYCPDDDKEEEETEEENDDEEG